MPARPAGHPTDADLARAARRPSSFAVRFADTAYPAIPDPAARSLADVADLSDELYRGGRLVGATLSGRAFVSLAGRFGPLTHVRLVAAGPVLPELVRCDHLAAVEHLDLTGCQVGDAGAALLAACPHFASLVSLDFGGNGLTVSGVGAITGAAWAGRLRAVGFGTAHVSVAELSQVLVRLDAVHDLDMTGVPLGPAGWAALAGRRFGRLTLAHCGLEGGDFARPVACEWLDLGFNAIGDAGLAALAAGGSLAGVRGLNLAGNRLTTLDPLVGRCPDLAWLDVRANRLGPGAWRALADPAAVPRLRRVAV